MREERIKYVIMSMVAGVIIMIGVSSIKSEIGETKIASINKVNTQGIRENITRVVIIGLTIKLGGYPVQEWIIRVYKRIGKEELIIVASLVKIVIVKLIREIPGNHIEELIIVGSITYGVKYNIRSTRIRDIVIGGLIVGTGEVVIIMNTKNEVYKYLIINIVYTVSLITLISKQERTEEWSSKKREVINIITYGLIGIPPLGGIYSKLVIIEEIIERRIIVVYIGLIIISIIYNMRIIIKVKYKRSKELREEQTVEKELIVSKGTLIVPHLI